MATEVDGGTGPTVEFKTDEPEKVKVSSPLKNRRTGDDLNVDGDGSGDGAGGQARETGTASLAPTGRSGSGSGSSNSAATSNKGVGPPVARRCCNSLRAFERMSSRWWNPQFNSPLLEKQLVKTFMPQTRYRFQAALCYIIVACAAWCAYFALMQQAQWIPFLAGTAVLLLLTLIILVFSCTPVYVKHLTACSVVLSIFLCVFCLLNFVFTETDVSIVGTFTGTVTVLLMMYTVIPLPLYVAVILGGVYSVTFELLTALLTSMSAAHFILARALMHVCIHLIGVHVFFMSQARKRSTFLKAGQSILSRRDLELEKQNKQRMINSLMPPKVAEAIMRSREKEENVEDEAAPQVRKKNEPSPQRGKITFRTFHMSQLHNVSILFADIVGFTNMSSNKTAEHLVSLLNDLFGRFDVLCDKSGCEKISTLGDCYYCVSGCPEPRPDHAQCCIEMGLGMVKAIQAFDEDHNEQVNMRVGVHTGTVLCGLVGTRRFKFDVWSNDVTLANMMESEGKPGMVHISESTYAFVEEDYEVDPGEDVGDIRKHKVLIEDYNTQTQQYQVRHVQEQDTIKTYFIVSRKRPVQVGPLCPKSPKDKESGANTDAIKISIDEKDTAQPPPSPQEPPDHQVAPASPSTEVNHVDNQADANGMSPTLLIGRRDTFTGQADDAGGEKDESKVDMENEAALLTTLKAAQQRAHEQNDKELVASMERDKHAHDYLHKPPINRCTLNFLKPQDEVEFRNHYLSAGLQVDSTFSSPRVSAFFDMMVSLLFLALISVCCFLGFTIRLPWIVIFSVALMLEFLMLLPLLLDVFVRGKVGSAMGRITHIFAGWYPRHVFGALLAALPVIAVYSNFSCDTFDTQPVCDMFYCILVIVSLLHFCNFSMLSSWMKSGLATLAGIVLLILLGVGVCSQRAATVSGPDDYNTTDATDVDVMSTVTAMTSTEAVVAIFQRDIFHGQQPLRFEIILNMALLLLLIWFLNREFEIVYRLSFHGDVQARNQRSMMQTEKEQADWLLHNIIPQHVVDVLKRTSKYCRNHSDVGVIFAKVVNFDDFYDESFEGGREYLRVLNELISDFEELFDDPKYKDVEKIKTIGSCLMAASGLNPQTRSKNKDSKAHLYALMDFSLGLLAKMEQFNMEIFNFDFEMSIGFNTGEVTAGVIGTTKLLYDIWGDTVNISSRMYSTGVHGRIQVTEDTANKLSDKFEFEYRGKTFVKGKGDMNTYLLVKKKDGASWE